ncbi:PREDICTED: acetylcholinesterase-like [Papilio polytes]|uniref:acetylcholinesterase-like n=1 Tax=Papilio polytes TaxID=76194 RepID=UPI000675E26B|nr:PREDICTED: acetylcholinesterase-like [Papilio polytes]
MSRHFDICIIPCCFSIPLKCSLLKAVSFADLKDFLTIVAPPVQDEEVKNLCLARVDPLVDTNVGLIRGLQATDGDYSMFLGIPYAKVNHTNPFGPSIPLNKFDGIFQAVHDTTGCPQLDEFSNTITGTIDCLQLSVYVPNTANSQNKVPVLVWIHGGSFYRGSASKSLYGPKFLVRHEVILVTLNYRLGPYGFMCLDTREVPGNQGLRDQLGALRWIKNNIEAFGGDGNKITLFGQSAGGRSVDFHLVSDYEKLFDKIIIQSGISMSPPVIAQVDSRPTLLLAEKLGLSTKDIFEALNFLSITDPHAVVAASLEIDFRFRPCIENSFDKVEKIISDYTMNKIIPKVKNTPMLVGHTNNERIMVYVGKDDAYLETQDPFNDRLEGYFDFNKTQLQDMSNIVRQFYIGDEKISTKNLQTIVDFESDFTYMHPIHRRMYQNIYNGCKNVYHYVFSYHGQRHISLRKDNVTIYGAAHSDELGYLFDMPVVLEDEITLEDQIIIDRMTTLWTNFAKFGDPTPIVSDLLPVKWIPVTDRRMFYYNIDTKVTLERRMFHKEVAFWDLFFKHNQHLQKGYRNISN